MSIYSVMGVCLKRQCALIHLCLIRCHCPVAVVLTSNSPTTRSQDRCPNCPEIWDTADPQSSVSLNCNPKVTALNFVLPHPPSFSTLHAPLHSLHIPSFPHTLICHSLTPVPSKSDSLVNNSIWLF